MIAVKLRGGAASDGSDVVDLLGTRLGPRADSDSDRLLICELIRLRTRDARAVVTRVRGNGRVA